MRKKNKKFGGYDYLQKLNLTTSTEPILMKKLGIEDSLRIC